MPRTRLNAMALLLFALAVPAVGTSAADVQLPSPKKQGGMAVLEALDRRASGNHSEFPYGEISREELSTLLWAASGRNRDDRGWTVPTAIGRDPYCDVYVAMADGVYLYDWRENKLVQKSGKDIRSVIPMQEFAKKAPCILVFVADGRELGEFHNPERERDFAMVLAGAMTQNIYLAGEALGVAARYVANLDVGVVRTELSLTDGDYPICITPLGKR